MPTSIPSASAPLVPVPIFTGLDSAWGGRAKGALCQLTSAIGIGGRHELAIAHEPVLVGWDDMVRIAKGFDADDHVVGIDQGLVVPNAAGQRPVEGGLASALMRDYGCGAHSSNTSNASCYGAGAGIWRLLRALDEKGFQHAPTRVPGARGRHYFELYPHPAILALFGHGKILAYKVARKNPTAWQTLLSDVAGLADAALPVRDVALCFPASYAQTKPNEDRLDAFLAAYVAAYFWTFGTKRSTVLGSLTTGYIVTPHSDTMLRRFRAKFDAAEINPTGDAVVVYPSPPCASMRAPATRAIARAAAPSATFAATPETGSGTHTLVVNDNGNVHRKPNRWIDEERVATHDLVLTFVEEDGAPTLRFTATNDGRTHAMKPADDATRAEWSDLARGCSNRHQVHYLVEAAYVPRG